MASTIKRHRRTKVEIGSIKHAMFSLLDEDHPMTVRQIFYRLVAAEVIDKTESEYQRTVCRLLADMRLKGDIPFGWISDNTRWMRKPQTYRSLEDAVEQIARFYRRDIWSDQDDYVEIWLEKAALAGVLYDETERWRVPLMVTRGYSSLSFLYEAAEAMANIDKPTHIYYFGDHDPSGVDISRNVEARLREFAPNIEIHFNRAAVTRRQIDQWNLPQRPTKKTDTRAKGFEGQSTEVDAIHPTDLRKLVRACIEQHIDKSRLKTMIAAERSERDGLHRWAAAFNGGATP